MVGFANFDSIAVTNNLSAGKWEECCKFQTAPARATIPSRQDLQGTVLQFCVSIVLAATPIAADDIEALQQGGQQMNRTSCSVAAVCGRAVW